MGHLVEVGESEEMASLEERVRRFDLLLLRVCLPLFSFI